MRLFIALPVSQETKKICSEFSRRLAGILNGAPIRWTAPDQYHLTLEFLGDVPESRIKSVGSILKETVKSYKPLKLSLKDINAFPNWQNPSVIVINSNDHDGANRLQADLNSGLNKAGFAVESRLWKPHLTLGRIKGPVTIPDSLIRMRVPESSWVADRVEMVESRLTPQGSKYYTLQEFLLG